METKLKEGDIPLFDLNDEDLIRFAYTHKNQLVMDTVNPEMMRRLRISIKEFNRDSSKQSNRIFWLTVSMGIVAFFQLILLLIQITQK